MIPEVRGTRPWGPSRKRAPKCLKGPKTTYTTIAIAEKQSKRSKRAHFRYTLGPPGPTQEMELMGPGGEGPSRSPPPVSPAMGHPPRNYDISASFLLTHRHDNFTFSTIFKIRWPKSEEKQNFGSKWVWMSTVYESVPSSKTSWRRPWCGLKRRTLICITNIIYKVSPMAT